ncbi:MAG: hypothetical protein BBJ57_07245 [Desulfobacterales bacterium PC51MH44]|nr:MAG: hypothetical protein BBJ57_07245 [Desulfobacterales bacterium PC51MH44]
MSDRTILPKIAKGIFGEKTFCGASKMAFTEHDSQTLFGGIAMPNISTESDGNWHMAIGSLIFVPLKVFVDGGRLDGWTLEDIIVNNGFEQANWKEK